jgi:lipocalin-like protein
MMTKLISALCGLLMAATPAIGDEKSQIVGTWQLLSWMNEFQDGSDPRPMYGNNPTGYIIFTAEGRFMTIIEAEGRKAPQTDEDRAAAFRSLVAYTGMYRLEDDKLTIRVDSAWTPAWVGTEQTRLFKLNGDRLQLLTPWVMSPNLGKMSRASSTWQRSK